MEDFYWLLILAIAIFFGSFIAGIIPLAFQFNEEHMKLLTAFGAGILVGTALIVILPEGVATLYGGGEKTHQDVCHSDPTEHEGIEGWMGASLAFGFVTMFLIDQFVNSSHSHKHIAVGSISSQDFEQQPKSFTSAFLGLLVHAGADGIALGAASVGNSPNLEFVVFLAILLHKAPGSFALTTFLLHEGVTRRNVRGYLTVFSLAAPICSILTYLLLKGYQFSTPQHIWTGLVLLYSAGSFLYVATIHVMPEIQDCHSDSNKKKLSNMQFVFMIAGIFTPLLLQFEHAH